MMNNLINFIAIFSLIFFSLIYLIIPINTKVDDIFSVITNLLISFSPFIILLLILQKSSIKRNTKFLQKIKYLNKNNFLLLSIILYISLLLIINYNLKYLNNLMDLKEFYIFLPLIYLLFMVLALRDEEIEISIKKISLISILFIILILFSPIDRSNDNILLNSFTLYSISILILFSIEYLDTKEFQYKFLNAIIPMFILPVFSIFTNSFNFLTIYPIVLFYTYILFYISSKILYEIAKEGYLPKIFRRLNKYGNPSTSIILTTLMLFLLFFIPIEYNFLFNLLFFISIILITFLTSTLLEKNKIIENTLIIFSITLIYWFFLLKFLKDFEIISILFLLILFLSLALYKDYVITFIYILTRDRLRLMNYRVIKKIIKENESILYIGRYIADFKKMFRYTNYEKPNVILIDFDISLKNYEILLKSIKELKENGYIIISFVDYYDKKLLRDLDNLLNLLSSFNFLVKKIKLGRFLKRYIIICEFRGSSYPH